MTDAEKKLRLAVQRRTRAWVDVYRQEPDAETLIRSLLLGVENGIRCRLYDLPDHERGLCPPGAILRAFSAGCDLAGEIPASILAPFDKRMAGRAV